MRIRLNLAAVCLAFFPSAAPAQSAPATSLACDGGLVASVGNAGVARSGALPEAEGCFQGL